MKNIFALAFAVTLALGASACGTNYNGIYTGSMTGTITGNQATSFTMTLRTVSGVTEGTWIATNASQADIAGTITGTASGSTYPATMTIPSGASEGGTYSATFTLSSGSLTGTMTGTPGSATITATQAN